MPLKRAIFRSLFHAACAIGRPIGGIRPRRIYDILGRLAYDRPEFAWFRNRWGDELLLSGHYHIDRNILIFGTYDLDLHLALERMIQPGMVCMDVGANLGEMALHMARKVGPAGAVHAFEPVESVRARLATHVERNARQDVVRVWPIALSSATGQAEIAYADASQDNQGLASIVNLSDKPGPLRMTIPTMTLDEFVQRHAIDRLDLMKIDIQGAEYALLEGGRESLPRLAPDLLMEISPDDLRHASRTSRDLCRMIESLGYSIFALSKGDIGRPIRAADVPEDFSATSVCCTRRGHDALRRASEVER